MQEFPKFGHICGSYDDPTLCAANRSAVCCLVTKAKSDGSRLRARLEGEGREIEDVENALESLTLSIGNSSESELSDIMPELSWCAIQVPSA